MSCSSFRIQESKWIASLGGTITRSVHRVTGADFIHLSCPAELENSLAVTFRTPCSNDHGLPHIVEHMVLQGSEKYPVKDLYVELEKRCFAGFAYGNTGINRTVYMCNSFIDHQFMKLTSVFLDAVFHPLLTEDIFRQEACRLEFETPGNSNSCLLYNGAVYNEMKGIAHDRQHIIKSRLKHALYPDSSTGKDSAGDYLVIPEASYRDTLDYHDRFYRPSNCLIFAITQIPFEEVAMLLDEELQNAPSPTDLILPAPQQELHEPTVVTALIPDDQQNKCLTLTAWAVAHNGDTVDSLTLSTLTNILCNQPESRLRQNLLKSGLGTSIYSTYTHGYQQDDLAIGLFGADKLKTRQTFQLITDSLADFVKTGPDEQILEHTMSSQELKSREKGKYWAESLLWKASAAWAFYEDVTVALDTDLQYSLLKDRLLAKTNLFESIVDTCLLQNTHRANCVFYPDNTHFEKINASIHDQLGQLSASLSDAEKRELLLQTKRQAEYLDEPVSEDSLSTLPIPNLALVMANLPGQLSVREKVLSSGTIISTDVNTSGICYSDLCFDLTNLPVSSLRYLSLYTDYLEESIEQNTHCGLHIPLSSYRITASTDVVPSSHGCKVVLKLSGCCLEKHLNTMLSAMGTLALQPAELVTDRIRDLASRKLIERRDVPDYWGNEQAPLMAKRELTEASFFENMLKGIPSLILLSEIPETSSEQVVGAISSIAVHIVYNAPRTLVWSGPESGYTKTVKWYEGLPAPHALQKHGKSSPPLITRPDITGFETRNPTSHLGLAWSIQTTEEDNVTALGNILNEILDEYAVKELMLRGGAYAAGSFYSDGILSFYSYRDPSPERSISVIKDSISNCIGIVRSRISDLDDYILAALKKANPVHHPSTANRTALKNYLSGKTRESTEQLNCSLKNTSSVSLLEFCSILSQSDIEPGICVIGSSDVLESMTLDKRLSL